MPHYANGEVAKHGDLAIYETEQNEVAGIIVSIQASEQYCNATAIPLAQRQKGTGIWFPLAGNGQWSFELMKCLPVSTSRLRAL